MSYREIIAAEAHNAEGKVTPLDLAKFIEGRVVCWPADTEFFVITENNNTKFESWIMD